jgi:hypothetical protein
MTVIVQQPTDSNGNPQPMVYDQDTGKIIVDHDGYYINGGKRLVNVPTVSEYVNSTKTSTLGLQEAFNSLSEKNRKIVIKAGYYDIGSNTLTLPNIPNATIEIEGEVPAGYNSQSSSLPNDSVGALIYSTYSSTNVYNGVIQVDSTGYSSGEFNEIHIKNIGIITEYDSSIGSAQAGAFNLLYANRCKIENCVAMTNEAQGNITSYSNTGSGVAGFTLNGGQGYAIAENCFAYNYHVGFIVSAHTTIIGCLAYQCATGIYVNFGTYTATYTDHPIQLVNLDIEQYYIAIDINSSASTCGIYGTLTLEWASYTTYLISDTGNLLYGELYILGHLTGTTDLDVTQNITCDGAENVIIRVPHNLYPVPTTPTVPTSATAQENTNPYPVNVYMYGGTVTEIQITKNGTAYTVFSNSTGLALSGQAYKLNPGDSITVTYTTAPTWEWMSD